MFLLFFLSQNSFRLCAWLIALLLAHKHTLYMYTHAPTHAYILIFLAPHMAITMVTKCTEHNRGGIFLSFKYMKTTIWTARVEMRERQGESKSNMCNQDVCVCVCMYVNVCVSKVKAQKQKVVSVLTLMSVDYPE